MGNFKPREPLTSWLEYELDTDLIDPPVLKVRLRFIDLLDQASSADRHPDSNTDLAIEIAMRAVAEWDLTMNGKPVPLTEGDYLRRILAEPVKATKLPLTLAVYEVATKKDNFRGN